MRTRPALVLAAVVVAAAVVAVALTSARDPYPLQPAGASQWNPVALGKPTQAVVLYLELRPGDRIELLGGETIGLPAAVRPTLYLSRPVLHADGDRVIGEALEPLAGAVIEAPASASFGPENTVGIVGQMTPTTAGTYQLTSVRLRFRVNGGGEQVHQGISVHWTVCADDPVPACEPAETEP
jgi:4-amino-4-deoxy-L-arabinose transferase-like glycosyltransferase